MAVIDDLIARIEDKELRNRIQLELLKMNRQKKFGLIFENHLPECTPLYDIPVSLGRDVAERLGTINEVWTVMEINGDKALCRRRNGKEIKEFLIESLVSVASFGDPIYPYLKPLDSVCNAPEDDLWHTLIEADNFHALQLLEYLYAGKVDCIYIDPPYNTGAKDWKYNNNYVDGNDAYRHSKWLSMMEKRLKVAKKLLNPSGSVLIIAIDEKEYLHLGCLLEELFGDGKIQMITTIIKPEGTNRSNEFSRTNEYLYFVQIGDIGICPSFDTMSSSSEVALDNDVRKLKYSNMRRREKTSIRPSRPNQFYPVFISKETGFIDSIGDAISKEVDRNTVLIPNGCYALWPLSPNGTEMIWGKHFQTAQSLLKDGFLFVENGKNPRKAVVKYLSEGVVKEIHSGQVIIKGHGDQGQVIGEYIKATKDVMPKTVWNISSHNAQTNGSLLIKKIIGENRFDFPKSLYAVKDAINFFVKNKKDALILDFFAGSGTTLHAVNLLNEEDGGKRRCILVTNNEVSEKEAKELTEQGFRPGQSEWDKYGIARYVTWPRTVCSITGRDVNNQPIKGSYLGTDRLIADGLKANAIFFQLSFLDKTSISLGEQFPELLPLLWLKAGGHGSCPVFENEGTGLPKMLIYSQNKMAVLLDTRWFAEFKEQININPDIDTVYIVTNYERSYVSMISDLNVKYTYQLYRDYLDNFRINQNRN